MHFQIALFSSLTSLATSAVTIRSSPTTEMVEHGSLFNIYSQAGCSNMENITMNAGSLPPPSAGLRLYHIAIGRGTQVSSDMLFAPKFIYLKSVPEL